MSSWLSGATFAIALSPFLVLACTSSNGPAKVGNILPAPSASASAAAAAPSGPISCGNETCTGDEACVHECCDITPCAPMESDGGCWPGSHAVPENGGECQNGCIEDHPECLPSFHCEAPSPDCTGRYCNYDCD